MVAAVAGAAVVAPASDAMGLACATLAARCVSSLSLLLVPGHSGVGLAGAAVVVAAFGGAAVAVVAAFGGAAVVAGVGLAGAGVVGGVGLAAAVAGGFCSAIGGVGLAAAGAVAVAAVAGGLVVAAVVACDSGSLLGIVLAFGSGTSSSTLVLVSVCGRLGRGAGCAARCRSSLAAVWLDELFPKNESPDFFQREGFSSRWSCSKSREPMTTTALCVSDACSSWCHPTHDFTCWREIP